MTSEAPPSSGRREYWRHRFRKFGRKALIFGVPGLLVLGLLVAGLGYLYLSLTLPKLSKLTDYKPALPTQFYASDLRKFAEYGTETRFLIPFEEIPESVVHAFVSSEDAHFFQHSGIDYQGIVRAFFKNLFAGRIVQGGSTITQQIAKSLLLTRERSYRRKIKEAFLARRIEKNLEKSEILFLYLNQIYLGHGAYGVQAAARNYFQKDIRDLDLAEAAMLAGLPQAPSRYSPFRSMQSSKERQVYVLRRMMEEGYITEFDMLKAKNSEVKIFYREDVSKKTAPDYAEHIRRYIQEKYGDDMLYEGGLKVYSTMDLDKQIAAQKAVQKGLEDLDHRQGYRGVIQNIDPADEAATQTFLEKRHKEYSRPPYIIMPSFDDFKAGKLIVEKPVEQTPLESDKRYQALVTDFDKKGNFMVVQIGTETGHIHLQDLKWVRPINPEVRFDANQYYLRRPQKKFKKGDVILVKTKTLSAEEKKSKKYDPETQYFTLEQTPVVQAALVSLNPDNGFVEAMIGGYDFRSSEFNRAVQSVRQPGSAFKPIIYAAALEKGYTPSSIIVDSPIVYETSIEDDKDFKWRPKNYGDKFHGDTPFRVGLVKSMNVITIKILQDIGIDFVTAYARKLGIHSPINRDLSLALGSLDVTPMEMTQIYSVFARQGRPVTPIFITKIEDRNGKILERHTDLDYIVSAQDRIAGLKKRIQNASWLIADKILASAPPQNENTEEAEGELSEDELEQEVATTEEEIESEEMTANLTEEEIAEAEEAKRKAEEEKKTFVTFENERLRLNRKEKNLLFEEPPPGHVLTPQTSYLITHLMTHVVRYGTGARANALGRPAAGKTGTTNDEGDAWFMGFTPNLVTGVWVGFDQKKPLGKGETGSRAALPIWLGYMQAATENTPIRDFDVPSKIVFSSVNKQTGLLANAKTPANLRIRSAYLESTQPDSSDRPNNILPDDQFFLIDSRMAPNP